MVRFVAVLCTLLGASAVCSLAIAAEISAGVAVVDITPPVPWRMSGYYTERVSTGVKDPLHAKAIVFRQGDAAAALVFCDLVGVPLDVTTSARKKASAATGIPYENISVTATHSHTGPLFFGVLRDHYHDLSVKRLGKDPNETIDYSAELADKVASAIIQATANAQPVQLAAGFGEEQRLSFNRRYYMKDGSVKFNPGQMNPDIVRPAGPIDPQVSIVSLRTADAKNPFAAIIAFAMHLDTTGGTKYSADYPKFMQDRLRQTLGKDFLALFGEGTCGNINHLDVSKSTVREPEEIGPMLAESVEEALKGKELAPIAEPSLAARSAVIETPLQTYTAEQIAKARENMKLVGHRELPFLDQVEASKIMALQAYHGASWPLEVQAFRLSADVAIVTLPAEIFVELGMAIKAESPFKTTIVIELANDSLGYIPTKQAFAEGSYEVTNSRVVAGGGELLVDTAVRLLKELK